MFLKFESANLKLVYSIMFVLCLTWSSFKLFETKTNEIYATFDKNFPYNQFDIKYCQKSRISANFPISCKLFPVLNMINNILNNVIFIFISGIIDLFMIKFAQENFQRKKEIFHDQKHLDEALMLKRNVKKLIITNGIIFFLSHVPEFILTLLLILFKNRLANFCFYFISCFELIEIFESFSLISISFQFFVFKHFDHNFILSITDLKKKIF